MHTYRRQTRTHTGVQTSPHTRRGMRVHTQTGGKCAHTGANKTTHTGCKRAHTYTGGCTHRYRRQAHSHTQGSSARTGGKGRAHTVASALTHMQEAIVHTYQHMIHVIKPTLNLHALSSTLLTPTLSLHVSCSWSLRVFIHVLAHTNANNTLYVLVLRLLRRRLRLSGTTPTLQPC